MYFVDVMHQNGGVSGLAKPSSALNQAISDSMDVGDTMPVCPEALHNPPSLGNRAPSGMTTGAGALVIRYD